MSLNYKTSWLHEKPQNYIFYFCLMANSKNSFKTQPLVACCIAYSLPMNGVLNFIRLFYCDPYFYSHKDYRCARVSKDI